MFDFVENYCTLVPDSPPSRCLQQEKSPEIVSPVPGLTMSKLKAKLIMASNFSAHAIIGQKYLSF